MATLPAKQKHLTAKLDKRLGRALYHYPNNGKQKLFAKNSYLDLPRGVSIQVAQWLVRVKAFIIFPRIPGVPCRELECSRCGSPVRYLSENEFKRALRLKNKGGYHENTHLPEAQVY